VERWRQTWSLGVDYRIYVRYESTYYSGVRLLLSLSPPIMDGHQVFHDHPSAPGLSSGRKRTYSTKCRFAPFLPRHLYGPLPRRCGSPRLILLSCPGRVRPPTPGWILGALGAVRMAVSLSPVPHPTLTTGRGACDSGTRPVAAAWYANGNTWFSAALGRQLLAAATYFWLRGSYSGSMRHQRRRHERCLLVCISDSKYT
jgi:hypothetical protein